MALIIERVLDTRFEFQYNGGDILSSDQNRLFTDGSFCHFKTGTGANIIKDQNVTFADITVIDTFGGTGSFTFVNIQSLWLKLKDLKFFDGLGSTGGGGGATTFPELNDTDTYFGNNGKIPIVNESELKLDFVDFYNFDKFTQLSDVAISSLIDEKLIGVTLVSGTPTITLVDKPTNGTTYFSAVGGFDYSDLDTLTTPLAYTTGDLQLTNDTLGTNTFLSQPPFGVTTVWDETTNTLDLNQLSIGDKVEFNISLLTTTSSANQTSNIKLLLGEGTADVETILIETFYTETAAETEMNGEVSFMLKNNNHKITPAKILFSSDTTATIKVDLFKVYIIRKSVNLLDVTSSGVDEPYDVTWDGNLDVPTKNTIYDKIESLVLGGGVVLDTLVYKILPIDFNFAAIPAGYDNATWAIRHDFDLATTSVTLPANVTLSFEGGSITNGSIALDNTTIAYHNIESILSDVVLTGTLTNDALDVRLFGILPDDNTIDATVIINTNLITLDLELLFPKGNFYFTELHITKNNFKLRGVTGTEIATRTTFNPFVAAGQYYIIKLGGGKFTLNDASVHIQYPIIQDIHFTTPIGYTASNLTSVTDITGITYVNAALVIDKVQVGKFAINGNTLHNTPLLTIGFSYELNFDYINMYGNHGLSDLPIIQIANNYVAGGYISASIIEKIQVEVFVGSVIKTANQAGANELTIGDVTIEGTIEWEGETITSETRFTDADKSLPAYYATVNRVPLFDLNGVMSMVINTMHINATSTEWFYDATPATLYTRTFGKFNLVESEIQINNLLDGNFSRDFYLEGSASIVGRNTLSIASINGDTAFYNDVTDNFDLKVNTHNKQPIKLKNGFEYVNDGLADLFYPIFLPGISLNNYFITKDEPAYDKAITSRWANYMINESGFYVDDEIITIIGKLATTNNAINIEYYDASDVLLSTQNFSVAVTANTLFTNNITLVKPANYSYLKLVNNNTGFLLNTYSLKTSNASAGGGVDQSADYTWTGRHVYNYSGVNQAIFVSSTTGSGIGASVDDNNTAVTGFVLPGSINSFAFSGGVIGSSVNFTVDGLGNVVANSFTGNKIDRVEEDLVVTGTKNIDWALYETFRFTMTGATVFSDTNLPTVGSKVITIHMDGAFAPTYPAGWTTYIRGTYDTAVLNTIVVEYVNATTDIFIVTISQPD